MTFAERRIAFRRWRRVRPFWGGLLLIVSGLELLQSGYLDLGSIQVHFGYEGFLSYLLPAVMVLTGVFSWVTPKQRLFYGIIGMLTAVYSLIGLNLGGWFLGMLLGIVGGAMVLAWSPGPTSSEPTPDDTAADPGPSAPESSMDETVVRSPGMHRVPEEEPRGGANARWSFRFLAILIPALVLVSGLGLSAAHPAVAADCPTAPAAAAAPAPTPSPSRTAKTAAELWREFWDRILGRNQPTPGPSLVEPTATPGPVPTCTEPAPTSPGAPPSATATDSGAPPAPGATTPGTDGGTAPGPSPSASPSPTVVPAPVIAAAPGQPIVSSRPARMTTSTLTLEGFSFDGVVDLPTANGTIRVLQFSIDRATNQDFRLVVDGNLAITSDPLVAAGRVKLFTSRFSGSLLGIPLTFTPDVPPPITLPNMVFTDVNLDLVFLDCDTLTGPTLDESANT